MIKYKILLMWYVCIIKLIVYMFGSHKQFWKYNGKLSEIRKMQKLTPLEKELM